VHPSLITAVTLKLNQFESLNDTYEQLIGNMELQRGDENVLCLETTLKYGEPEDLKEFKTFLETTLYNVKRIQSTLSSPH
jgi:hypothetical protein